MSKSGRQYLHSRALQRRNRWKQTPAIKFIKSFDFIGKFALGALCIGFFAWDFPPVIDHPLIMALALISMLLFPFAKRGSDDVILHLSSEKTFEIINSGGTRGMGAIYLLLLLPFSIPFGLAYCIYHFCKYRADGRSQQ